MDTQISSTLFTTFISNIYYGRFMWANGLGRDHTTSFVTLSQFGENHNKNRECFQLEPRSVPSLQSVGNKLETTRMFSLV